MNDERTPKSLEQRLQDTYRVEPSKELKQRLLSIPEVVPRTAPGAGFAARASRIYAAWTAVFDWRVAVPALSVLAALGILWAAGMRITQEDPAADFDDATAQAQAWRDFVIVMNYLNSSTVRASAAVQGELGAGLMAAFERGEQSFKDTSNQVTNGG
ncbi:MAG: hypothetical protein PVF63_10240 [Gammaproteobacteria bacterium]|jgi:hypothetical protein